MKQHLVFWVSLGIALVFGVPGVLMPEAFLKTAEWMHGAILAGFGWAYLGATLLFLIFSLYLALGRYGSVRLGRQEERPQFSYFGWFSMLFAAGMGIGLIFWGVAEPMSHYLKPPPGAEPETAEAARQAMQYSFFHWGVTPWAVYITMSLSIAYFSFRRGMPPLISSCFYPLLGERIHGGPGYLIDILAVFATLFGIVTSLGLGAMQITSGLGEVFGIPTGTGTILAVIAVVTVLFMISTMTGVEKGIQILSKTNIVLALTLLSFVFVIGPTLTILNILTQGIADFATGFVEMSLSTNPFEGHDWTHAWTFFYWAWWIAWAPFVGLFVASISRGRTIREFVGGALVVPVLLTFLWFSAFGGSAFEFEFGASQGIAETIGDDVSTGLFHLYELFPLTPVLSLITILLLGVFFITSADSATYVLSMMTSGGKLRPPAVKKIVWGLMISGMAAVLLQAGGLEALQKMAITAALPFTFLLLGMGVSLLKGLEYEWRVEGLREKIRLGSEDVEEPALEKPPDKPDAENE
ncbi:MAG: BCCT family transporter [Opitutales bacterium]